MPFAIRKAAPKHDSQKRACECPDSRASPNEFARSGASEHDDDDDNDDQRPSR